MNHDDNCVPCADGEHATIEPDDNGIERCTCCGEHVIDETQQGTVHVHANGVVELDPADIRATVCDTCERAWDDTVSTAVTPVPAGRCPFEYEHSDGCDECGEDVPECANPEHEPYGRCEDCCEDCRDARQIGPGFVIPLDNDESEPVEPSAALLYRINDALTAICDEAHVTLPDDVLDNLTHAIANEIQRGDRDEAR